MKLLLYATPPCPRAEELAQMIHTGLPHVHTTHTGNVDTLNQHLKRPMNRFTIVLAFIPDTESLEKLSALSALLEDKKLILILPEADKHLFSKSLQLTPSYVSYQERDPMDVILVINQIGLKHFAMNNAQAS
ncbi:MAG: hypothetical protein MI802_15760 [Desulfobacterales bacterium]|nr:hypothetical protein [Desulfobacterales bacterium]